jgi:phthalate 4,5-dioxygenase oxygenase subunit
MGPIADRTHDRLGASDLAIVEFRRQMVDAVQSFIKGEPPIGVGPLSIPQSVCSYQAVVPKEVDWRDYQAQPV